MDHFYQDESFGENWFNYQELYSKIVMECATDEAHFVEVGSWKGKSAAYMAVEILNSKKKIKFDCVDTWLGSSEHVSDSYVVSDTLYELFLNNIKPVANLINAIRKPSVEAANLYKNDSLDFVFIDACHDYSCVLEDINAWLPKLKTNCIIAGHDIHHPDVFNAVNDRLKNFTAEYNCWIYRKK